MRKIESQRKARKGSARPPAAASVSQDAPAGAEEPAALAIPPALAIPAPAKVAVAPLQDVVAAGTASPVTVVDPLAAFFMSESEGAAAEGYAPQLSTSAAAAAARTMAELLAIWIADEEYAVDILEIQEIIKVPQITDLPNAPRAVLGIASLRGTIIPILDLRTVLALEQHVVSAQSRILVLRGDGEPVGLLVDRVSNVVRLERDSIEAVPRAMQRTAANVLDGVGRIGDRLLILLNLPAVLSSLEVSP